MQLLRGALSAKAVPSARCALPACAKEWSTEFIRYVPSTICLLPSALCPSPLSLLRSALCSALLRSAVSKILTLCSAHRTTAPPHHRPTAPPHHHTGAQSGAARRRLHSVDRAAAASADHERRQPSAALPTRRLPQRHGSHAPAGRRHHRLDRSGRSACVQCRAAACSGRHRGAEQRARCAGQSAERRSVAPLHHVSSAVNQRTTDLSLLSLQSLLLASKETSLKQNVNQKQRL